MITVEKPMKYVHCASCGVIKNLNEYLFRVHSDNMKQSITLCDNCVTEMYKKCQEAKDDKGTENN